MTDVFMDGRVSKETKLHEQQNLENSPYSEILRARSTTARFNTQQYGSSGVCDGGGELRLDPI